MENKTSDKSLFETLKEIRIEKRISLEEIAHNSKIQFSYIEAVEKGELENVPQVYDKLFFKAYLKAIGQQDSQYYNQFLEYRKSVRTDKTTTIFDFSKTPESHQ